MKAWAVYLNGKKIDTVFYTPDVSQVEVTLSLINDGYHPLIVVKEA